VATVAIIASVANTWATIVNNLATNLNTIATIQNTQSAGKSVKSGRALRNQQGEEETRGIERVYRILLMGM